LGHLRVNLPKRFGVAIAKGRAQILGTDERRVAHNRVKSFAMQEHFREFDWPVEGASPLQYRSAQFLLLGQPHGHLLGQVFRIVLESRCQEEVRNGRQPPSLLCCGFQQTLLIIGMILQLDQPFALFGGEAEVVLEWNQMLLALTY